MSITSLPDTAAAAVVARARQGISELDGRLWAAVSDTDLIDVIGEITRLRAHLAAVEAEVLVEVDLREIPRKQLRWGSTTDWYAHATGTTRGAAKRAVRHARDLTGERTATHAALREGAVSPTQAGVVCDGIADLPGDRMLRHRAETVLLDQATRLDATDLSRTARRVLDLVDPDHDDRRIEAELAREDRAAHADRYLAITDDGAGGVRIKGRGSLEDGAVLRAALLPLTKPEPSLDVDCGDERDLRDHGARLWDALVQSAQHGLDTSLPPTSHGTVPRVSVTIPIADLLAGLGSHRSGATDDGLDLHPAVVRRLACDAEIVPVTLGTEGCVLDVGRAHRTVTPSIWRALITRDRHCAFPGCSRPPVMTHAHHIVHWADGGPTSLQNLALVCGEHHRTLHHTPWHVRINREDRRPEFLPPPRHRTETDETQSWIRHRTRNHPRRE